MIHTTNQVSASSEQAFAGQWVHSLWFRILLLTALGLGIFFRIAGLGNKIYSHDEAYTSLNAAGYFQDHVIQGVWDGQDTALTEIQAFIQPGQGKDIMDTLSIMALYESHQGPLYFLLAHYWMRLIGDTPAAMRGLSAVFGLLSILALYWLTQELFRSTRVALISTALFAISPFHILFSQDARPYSLWTLMTLVSSVALLQAMRKDQKVNWLIYSLTLILGIYTHQLIALLIVVHVCYFAAIHVMQDKKGYTGFLSAGLFAFLAFVPWLFFMVTRWEYSAGKLIWADTQFYWQLYVQRWALIFSSPIIDLDLPSGNLLPYALRALVLLFIVYALFALVRRSQQREWLFILLVYIITAGAFIFSDIFPGGSRSINGRYFIPANIATILVAGYFLSHHLDQSRRHAKLGWALLVGVLMAAAIASDVNSLQAKTWWNKELSRVQPELVSEINKEQTLLIVTGIYPTNLGDVLALSSELDADVHFKLYGNAQQIEFGGNYRHIYYLPYTYEELQQVVTQRQLQVTEVIPGMLWRIDGISG